MNPRLNSQDNLVIGGVSLPKDAVILEKRDGFDVPKILQYSTGGIPGAPALPQQTQFIVLPRGGDILSFKVIPGESVKLPGKVRPLPAQEIIFDIGTDPIQFRDRISIDNVITFTPPDPEYYQRDQPYPEELAEIDFIEDYGIIRIAVVNVQPLQYDPNDEAFIFYPNLRYEVKFDLEKAREICNKREKQFKVGYHYTEIINDFLSSSLVNSANDLFWPKYLLQEEIPYIIITDNYEWPDSVDRGDGTTRAPDLSERGSILQGDLVDEFELLAKWKTMRGTRTRVFTITDIVEGKFGDFTENDFALDLQEALRNFFKYAHENWGTLYVLLGGDVNVVPMRRLTGSEPTYYFGCSRQKENPPLESRCYYISGKSSVKLRPAFEPLSTDPLSTWKGGIRIPYDSKADSGRLGWYFTIEEDFEKNDNFTRLPHDQPSSHIIVEGPPSIIDDDYYWFRDINSIPSDFYYASLIGPGYSVPGKHDFDSNNNGLYGQYCIDSATKKVVMLDDVDKWSDIWVGRVSVENEEQTRAYVKKVITYERLMVPDSGKIVDSTYLSKILYAAGYFNRVWHEKQTDTSIPPAEGSYTHVNGSNVVKLHSKFDINIQGGTPSYRVVARLNTTYNVIPYNNSADASQLGWFFTTDDGYTNKSSGPTRFIKIMGPEPSIDATMYFLDPMWVEWAADQKEDLRTCMDVWFPTLNSVERHYHDYFDLTTPPPIVPLEKTTVRAALDDGVHFVSLSGHGGPEGCCEIYTDQDFTNENKYFIVYANSCTTARPDDFDSLAEVSTYSSNGGAIGYVGCTRFGSCDAGIKFEKFFWGILKWYSRLGPSAGLRLAYGGITHTWMSYTQTLFGDPEMRIWTEIPSKQEVLHPSTVHWGDTITVTVKKNGNPSLGHRVTIMGGWMNSSLRPRVLMSKDTDVYGNASFSLPSSGTPLNQVSVTVTKKHYIPYVGLVTITS